jgi:hypothetical protein
MRQLHEIAVEDPALIPGIYNYCDEWCSYCPSTTRCLVYRLRQTDAACGLTTCEGVPEPGLNETIEEGRPVPVMDARGTFELEGAMLAHGEVRATFEDLDDPLDNLAFEHAADANRLLRARGWMPPPDDRWRPRPTQLDVIAWYHVMIAVKIHRAVVGGTLAAVARSGSISADVNGSAKVALVGIDRSRTALRHLPLGEGARAIGRMLGRLDRFASAVEERFPEARSFTRPGLDAAVV